MAKQTAQRELAAQPRDASPVRLRRRDAIDGRPRGYLRKFGLPPGAGSAHATSPDLPCDSNVKWRRQSRMPGRWLCWHTDQPERERLDAH
jgi:hypothetical protein